MKKCNRCDVKINTNIIACSLCKTVLIDIDHTENVYPKIEKSLHKYNIIIRILLFLSIIISITSIGVNYFAYNKVLWSIITIASILYFWSIILHSIKHNINIASKILVQTISLSLLSVTIDYIIGYIGWSVNYVIPSLIIIASISILIPVIVNRMNWRNYVIYQIAITILGFIPIILYFFKLATKILPIISSTSVSLLILCWTIIFEDKEVKEELKRRLHF